LILLSKVVALGSHTQNMFFCGTFYAQAAGPPLFCKSEQKAAQTPARMAFENGSRHHAFSAGDKARVFAGGAFEVNPDFSPPQPAWVVSSLFIPS